MFSRPIDYPNLETKKPNTKQDLKRPAPFPKERKKLSKQLQDGSLHALKELLAKQKQNTALSAAGPFQDMLAMQQASTEPTSTLKIEPSAQVMQLYSKLVEALIHTNHNGIQETTFFLEGDAFNSSAFQGSKITITEYSTAPKIFNIEFSADPKALSFFEAHAADLLNALQKGNFGFEVNRLDTTLLTEDEKYAIPLVERDLEKEEQNT